MATQDRVLEVSEASMNSFFPVAPPSTALACISVITSAMRLSMRCVQQEVEDKHDQQGQQDQSQHDASSKRNPSLGEK